MYIIIQLTLDNNDMRVIASFDDLINAKAMIHDLNKNDEVSYRDEKMKFFKVYKKNWYGRRYEAMIYKILEIPPIKYKITK